MKSMVCKDKTSTLAAQWVMSALPTPVPRADGRTPTARTHAQSGGSGTGVRPGGKSRAVPTTRFSAVATRTSPPSSRFSTAFM